MKTKHAIFILIMLLATIMIRCKKEASKKIDHMFNLEIKKPRTKKNHRL